MGMRALAAIGLILAAATPALAGATSFTLVAAVAGSLAYANARVLGPAWGGHLVIDAGGSWGLARQIASRILNPDIMESVGSGPLSALGADTPRWRAALATAPLVLAFDPRGRDARYLRQVARGRVPARAFLLRLAQGDLRLGRTDPLTDPQGQAFVMAVDAWVRAARLPPRVARRILGPLDNPRQVLPEVAVLTQLTSGAVDLASAFEPQARQRHLDWIALPAAVNFGEERLRRAYARLTLRLSPRRVVHGAPLTVWVAPLPHAAHPRAARSFLTLVLSPRGRRLLQRLGYRVLDPAVLAGHAPGWARRLAR